MTRHLLRWKKRIGLLLAASLASGTVMSDGCIGSDIGKRFRETYATEWAQGMNTALSTPGEWETGLRQMGVALSDAIAAVIDTRTPSSLGSNPASSGLSSGSGA
jgi:urocanate hydratase